MGFIDEDDRRWRNPAPCERLDGTDLHRLRRIRAPVAGLHDGERMNSFALEGGDGLLYERDRRHGEDDTAAFGQRAVNGVRCG